MTAFRHFPRLGACAAALVLLVAPGCLKVKSTISLAKDGSGTLSEKATLDLSKFKELGEMMGAMMPGAEGGGQLKDAQSSTDMEAIKKRLEGKPCIKLQLLSQTQDFEAETVTGEVKLKFTSLGDCLGAGLGTTSARSVELSLESGAEGTWTLTRKMMMPGGMEVPETLSPEDQAQMDMFKPMLEGFFSEMEVVVAFEVPGEIVSTNGTKNAAGNGVSWTMGFTEVTDPKKLKQTVTFKGEGLTLKPFRVRLDEKGDVIPDDGKGATTPPAGAPKETPKEPAAPGVPK